MNYRITAAAVGKLSVMSLIQLGVNANERGLNGETLLMAAIIQKDMESFDVLLVDKGLQINLADKNGNTALHLAAERGELEFVQKLMARGAVVKKNKNMETPNSLALKKKHVGVLKVLQSEPNDAPQMGYIPCFVGTKPQETPKSTYHFDKSSVNEGLFMGPVMCAVTQLAATSGPEILGYIQRRWGATLENY